MRRSHGRALAAGVAAAAALLAGAALCGCQALLAGPLGRMASSRQAANDARIREQLAFQIGTLAYVYGYPLADMQQQMHNETHRVSEEQLVLAPLNHFFVFPGLVTPATQGNLRQANNDTVYLSGWFDLAAEPVLIHVPDTADRYYTLGIMDLYSEAQHIGRRTTGTREGYFALVGPGWQGQLPAGVTPLPVPTTKAWVLGRVLVDGPEDYARLKPLLAEFWAAPLSRWQPGRPPEPPAPERAAAQDTLGSLEFFAAVNRGLRENPIKPGEAALLDLFDQIGVGPHSEFDAARLDPESRRGLERALEAGQELVRAASQRSRPNVHRGWIIPLELGVFGSDYLMRAANVYGGYSNRPEETVYAVRLFGDDGGLLLGSRSYRLHFPAGGLPPVHAFWSLTAYDLRSRSLVENALHRYSLGDRTRGLRFGGDGSLDLYLGAEEPEAGSSNWLPTPDGPMLLVLRMYEPDPRILDGRYELPALEELR